MKNTATYKNGKGTCYIPELSDIHYTKNDFLEIAENNEKLADIIFNLCDWQHPETVFQELLNEGEIDNHGNLLNQNT